MGRNAAAWEQTDVREICRLEFSTEQDRELSVYEVHVPVGEDARLWALRVHAEHFASFRATPPLLRIDVDVDGLFNGEVKPLDPETEFELTRGAHRGLVVEDVEQVVRMVERLREVLAARSYAFTRDEVRAYASARYRANDSEWVAARKTGKFGSWKLTPEPP